MKIANLRIYLVLLMAFAVVGVACNKDEEDPQTSKTPSIVFNTSGGAYGANDSVDANTPISFNIVITKGNDGKQLRRIKPTVATPTNGGAFAPIPAAFVNVPTNNANDGYSDPGNNDEFGTINPNADSYTLTVTDYLITGLPGQKFRFKFTVEDNDGNSAERIIEITVKSIIGPGPTAPKSFTLVVDTSNAAFFTLTDSGTVLTSAVANGYDLYSFYSPTAGSMFNFVSGDAANNSALGVFAASAAGRTTGIRISSVTAATFNSLNDESTLTNYYTSGTTQSINGWNAGTGSAPNDKRLNGTETAIGEVFAFNVGSKYGLVYIESVSGTNMTLRVKVQN